MAIITTTTRLQSLCLLIALASCSALAPAQTRRTHKIVKPLFFRNESEEELMWELPMKNEMPIVGRVFKGTYLIDRQVPCGSEKIQLFEAFHVMDRAKENPMIVKLSQNIGSIQVEYEVYRTIHSQLRQDERDCFVQIYDRIDEPHCVPGQSALVMEKGEENLRTHLQRLGRFQGSDLRSAMEKVIRIVDALHDKGMVWTEIKPENFVVQRDGTIKGIDLESVIYHQNFLQMYTAESVPPEFPIADIYQCVPSIQPDYSYDIWGLGILMFEMATGKSFYDGGLDNVEFIKEKLYYKDEIEPFVNRKLWEVDPEARHVIQQCLRVDPNSRSSTRALLQFPFFSKARRATRPISSIPAQGRLSQSMVVPKSNNNNRQHMQRRQNGVLDISLSQRMDAVIDAFKVYARQNPTMDRILSHFFQWNPDPAAFPQFFQAHDISTQRFESLMMAINTVEKFDPQAAREFLYILHQTV